ncbi:Zn-ribbon domain-containing OB-fold protein [Rhodococcus koreensis]
MTYKTGPLPDTTDPDFAPFWAGTKQEQILIPECTNCTKKVWPPRPVCSNCYNEDFEWKQAPRSGRLYTWTVVHHKFVDSMDTPYAVVVVELDDFDGVRLLGNLSNGDLDVLEVGMSLTADFCAVTDECSLVNWQPTAVSG